MRAKLDETALCTAHGHLVCVVVIGEGGPTWSSAVREVTQALVEGFAEPPELAPSDRARRHYLEGERLLDLDPEPALAALHQAITTADAVGNDYIAAVARVSYASLLSRTGDPAAAMAPFADLIVHWRSHGDRTHLLTTLRNLVTVLDRLDMPERAAELLGAVLGDSVAPSFGSERALLEGLLHRLEKTLGRVELDRRLDAGGVRTIDDAARVAQQWLAELASARDDRRW